MEKPQSTTEPQEGEVAKDFFLSESDATGEADGHIEEPDAESADRSVEEEVVIEKEDEKNVIEKFESTKISDHSDYKKGIVWPEKAAALRNFVKERGIVVSKVIRRLSGRKEDLEQAAVEHKSDPIQENLGLDEGTENGGTHQKGRVIFFSKSGCPDSKATRCLLREKGVSFVEINLDVFPLRSLELEERTGTSSVPQVFFNEHLIGGIDELNSLQESGELDAKIKEVIDNACPTSSDAPNPPSYGEDDPENSTPDEFADVVRKLREKVQLKDRFVKLRIINRCFVGSEAVDFLAEDQYCERDEAVEFGRKLAVKHFFHHVLHEHSFEDGNNFYRFLEHDPIVTSKCLNFSGTINSAEPKPAAEVAHKLTNLILAIYESYVSLDGKQVDYIAISMSEEFRRYVKASEELHRIDLLTLTREEKLSFFINIYNAMVIHAIIRHGKPSGPLERRIFFGEIQYLIAGYAYSLSAIHNGILRANLRPPYALTKVYNAKDNRLKAALSESEPLVHFALCGGTHSSPAIKCYTPQQVDAELRFAARSFFNDGGIIIDSEARTVVLSKIMKWYSVDFGKNEREVLNWVAKHIDPTKAEHLLNLLEDNSPFKLSYFPYDWTLNF